MRRSERDTGAPRYGVLRDPDDVSEAVARGFAAIKKGESIDLNGERELRRFFADVIARGKRRLASRMGAART